MTTPAHIEPPWLIEARKHEGQREVKGPRHNARIIDWLTRLKAWWQDDETPWCGVFVAHCVGMAGHELPRYWMRAKDWLNWGESIACPVVGAVVVFTRDGGGHVGFVVGKDAKGNLMVLGGNQGDMVKMSLSTPFLIAGGLPGWYVLGWLFRYMEKRKNMDIMQVAQEMADDVRRFRQ